MAKPSSIIMDGFENSPGIAIKFYKGSVPTRSTYGLHLEVFNKLRAYWFCTCLVVSFFFFFLSKSLPSKSSSSLPIVFAILEKPHSLRNILYRETATIAQNASVTL